MILQARLIPVANTSLLGNIIGNWTCKPYSYTMEEGILVTLNRGYKQNKHVHFAYCVHGIGNNGRAGMWFFKLTYIYTCTSHMHIT